MYIYVWVHVSIHLQRTEVEVGCLFSPFYLIPLGRSYGPPACPAPALWLQVHALPHPASYVSVRDFNSDPHPCTLTAEPSPLPPLGCLLCLVFLYGQLPLFPRSLEFFVEENRNTAL